MQTSNILTKAATVAAAVLVVPFLVAIPFGPVLLLSLLASKSKT